MASSWRAFALVFLGIGLLLGSVLGFLATVEYDHHCEFNTVRDAPSGQEVAFYTELTPAQQDLFERMIQRPGVGYTNASCTDAFAGQVKYQGRYYDTGYWRTFHWTDPTTLGVVAAFLAGLGAIGAAVSGEMRRKPW